MDSNSTFVSNVEDYIKIFSYKIFAKAFQSSVFENDSTPDEFLSSYERFFSSQSETNQSTDKNTYNETIIRREKAVGEPHECANTREGGRGQLTRCEIEI